MTSRVSYSLATTLARCNSSFALLHREDTSDHYRKNLPEVVVDYPVSCRWKEPGVENECGEVIHDVQSMAEHLEKHVDDGINAVNKNWMCYWNECKRGRRKLCKKGALLVHLQQHSGEYKFQVL